MNHGLPAELDSLRAFLPELVTQAMERVPNACALVTQSGGESAVKTPSVEQVNPIPPGPGIRISVCDGANPYSLATRFVGGPQVAG